MIKVNLLPKDLLPKKRNFLPHIVVAALAAVLFVWFGSSLTATYSELSGKTRELNQLQDELAKLKDVVQQVKQLEGEKQLLSQKEQAVVQITSGRTVWSHELYILAGLVPKDIWLEQLTIGSRKRPVTVEVPNTNRSPGQPPTIKKTVVQSFPALRLTGYALSPQREKGVELVADLIRNMKADGVFSKRFVSPEMVSIERQKYKDMTVMKFVMDCEIES